MLDVRELRSPLIGPLSFSVEAGECVAMMGPSGAGKSLLLRAVADLDLSTGAVSLDTISRDAIPAFEWRRRVALVPAESGWWADTVAEHFTEGMPPPALLDALGLDAHAMDWQVARLSSGERQRLAIARAIVLRPSVLLLDEPTASLDAANMALVEAVIEQQLADGVAIVLVTHDATQATRLAARTLALVDGRIEPSLDDRA